MINVLRAEILRLRRSPGIRLSLVLAWFCAVLTTCLEWWGHRMSTEGSYTSYNTGALSEVVVGVCLGVVLIRAVVVQDYEHSTATSLNLVATPAQLVTAKTLLVGAGMGLVLLPYALVAMIGLAPFGEFLWASPSPLMAATFDSTVYPGGDRGARSVVVILMTVLNMTAQVSVCLPLAFALRRSLPTLSIGMALVFFLQIMANSFDRMLYVGALFQMTPFSWSRVLRLPFTETEVVASVAVSVFFMAAMMVISLMIVRRRDVR